MIFLSLVSLFLRAQDVISVTNGKTYKPDEAAIFLQSLYKLNDFVISYRLRFPHKITEKSEYFILTKTGSDLAGYNYLDERPQLNPLSLSKQSLQLIWDTFAQNELFFIRNEKDIPNFCPEKYQIYNSHTYEFVLYNKGEMKTLTYYDPEYYDNACYGMSERTKIINSVAVINYVLNQ